MKEVARYGGFPSGLQITASTPARQMASIRADPAGPVPGQAAQPQGDGAADGSPVIRAVGLTLGFGKATILSDISLNVRRGVVTALLGPTGSGKTTLLRTLNRMNDKVSGYRHSGDVLLDGHSIWNPGMDAMSLRRKVGMLFQRPNPFPMSIMDNVVAGVRRTGWPAVPS